MKVITNYYYVLKIERLLYLKSKSLNIDWKLDLNQYLK